MDFQTIKPITKVSTFGGVSPINLSTALPNNEVNNAASSFSDMYMSIINNYNEAHAQVEKDAIDLAAGSIDDLHTITINAQKANIALNLATSVTSKVLNAYNDIMKMNI